MKELLRQAFDAAAERSFWMNAQASSLASVWGDDDDQLFAARIKAQRDYLAKQVDAVRTGDQS